MPGRNGTGPMGSGPATGRGMGYCAMNRPGFRGVKGGGWFGMGRGRRGGFGFGFPRGVYASGHQIADLKDYQRYLQEELDYVNGQLNQEE